MNYLQKCPVCTGYQFKHFRKYFESYLVECKNCKFVFMNPIPTEDWINRYYQQSSLLDENNEHNDWWGSPGSAQERVLEFKYPKSFERRTNEMLNSIEEYIKPGKMLDIGCSLGTLLKVAKGRGWETTGIELAREVSKYSHEKYGLDIYTSDLLELGLKENSFDCITMVHVLEHLTNLHEYMNEVYRLLKPDAILYIRVPNLNSLKYKLAGQYYFLHVSEHISFFSIDSLSQLLRMNGFTILQGYTHDITNDPYFYFGIVKRIKMDNILFKILGCDKKIGKNKKKISRIIGLIIHPIVAFIKISIEYQDFLICSGRRNWYQLAEWEMN